MMILKDKKDFYLCDDSNFFSWNLYIEDVEDMIGYGKKIF